MRPFACHISSMLTSFCRALLINPFKLHNTHTTRTLANTNDPFLHLHNVVFLCEYLLLAIFTNSRKQPHAVRPNGDILDAMQLNVSSLSSQLHFRWALSLVLHIFSTSHSNLTIVCNHIFVHHLIVCNHMGSRTRINVCIAPCKKFQVQFLTSSQAMQMSFLGVPDIMAIVAILVRYPFVIFHKLPLITVHQ